MGPQNNCRPAGTSLSLHSSTPLSLSVHTSTPLSLCSTTITATFSSNKQCIPSQTKTCFLATTHTPFQRYRKIPGDRCEAGIKPERKEIDLRKVCVSSALLPKPLVSLSTAKCITVRLKGMDSALILCFSLAQAEDNYFNPAPVVVIVMLFLLLSAAAGVLLVKKYVCGGRYGYPSTHLHTNTPPHKPTHLHTDPPTP